MRRRGALEDDDLIGKAYDARLMRRFLGYMRPHAGLAALSFALVLAEVAAKIAAPFIIRAAVDGPVEAGNPAGLWLYAAAFFGIAALTGAFAALEHYVSNLAGQRILLDLRRTTFAQLQRLPVAYFDRNPVGRLIVRVTSDIENLSELFRSGLVSILANGLMLAGVVAAMLLVSWRLTLWTMATVPLAVAGAVLFRRYARQAHRDARKAVAEVAAYLNESVGGIKTIRVFSGQKSCEARFDKKARSLRDRSLFTAFVYSFFWPGIEFVSTMALGILLWYAGVSILAGSMTFGSFLAFWYLVRRFFDPIQHLAEVYNILQSAMASSERIFKILDTEPGIAAPPSPARPEARGEIVFEDVCLSYDDGPPVLKNVSFRVAPGEKVALVGYTGAGKTSVLSLLLRLYDVTSGRVLVDGVDVREHDPTDLRRRFGTVFQDVFLFSGTVGRNIRLGEDVPQDRVERAMRLSNAERVLERLPKGYESEIQERGSALSAGERQLLSFARALASDPPVLVLDEATSSVDAETEGLIQDALEKIMKDRTAVIVAHRLSTIRQADRILVLHHGELVEQGTHEELLRRRGVYEKLHRLQWRPA